MVVVRGGLAVGTSSYDVVMAEHAPLMPGGESCRSCGFVYTGRQVCPALILAVAGYPALADRIQIVPTDREYSALCELSVAVARMEARLDVIGSRVTAAAPGQKKRHSWWARIVSSRASAGPRLR